MISPENRGIEFRLAARPFSLRKQVLSAEGGELSELSAVPLSWDHLSIARDNIGNPHNWFVGTLRGGRSVTVIMRGTDRARGIGGDGPFVFPSQAERYVEEAQSIERQRQKEVERVELLRRTERARRAYVQSIIDSLYSITSIPPPELSTPDVEREYPLPARKKLENSRFGPLVKEGDSIGESMAVGRVLIVDEVRGIRLEDGSEVEAIRSALQPIGREFGVQSRVVVDRNSTDDHRESNGM